MSKPSVLGDLVNQYTYESHLGQFVAKFVRVEGVVGGHVLIVVDLAAWLYMSTGQAAAAVLREIPSNLGEVTFCLAPADGGQVRQARGGAQAAAQVRREDCGRLQGQGRVRRHAALCGRAA